MPSLAEFLSGLLGGQQAPQAGLRDALDNYGPGALSNPQFMQQAPMAAQGALTGAIQPPQAAQAQPMPQGAPAPAPGGGMGNGGIGGAIQSIFMPQAAGRNKTVQWLQSQGLDEGTATLLASNKPALQQYLLKRSQGADPMDALKLEKTQFEIENLRNPTTDDIKEYQFYANAEREAGRQPLDPSTWWKEQKKSGATSITNTVGGLDQTKGRTKVDEKYAEDFVDWTARGAYADVNKQIEQLESALVNLETKDNLTGPFIGSLPDAALAVTNPEAVATREMVEEVVQRNLRLVLGAQFTEKEGERLIARAYNPRLGEKENARRVRRLITQIKTAAEAKQAASEYFNKHGTLTGWGGKIPTMSDFDPEGTDGEEDLESLLERYGD